MQRSEHSVGTVTFNHKNIINGVLTNTGCDLCPPKLNLLSEEIYSNSSGAIEMWPNMVVIFLRPQEATFIVIALLLLTVARNGCSSVKGSLHFTILIYTNSV